jgi:hypothetical protein
MCRHDTIMVSCTCTTSYLYISELFIESLGYLSARVHGRDGDVLRDKKMKCGKLSKKRQKHTHLIKVEYSVDRADYAGGSSTKYLLQLRMNEG